MILVKMRPEQLQDAVKRNVPVIMPAGVIEYHGPHLPIGTDFLIANAVCDGVEKKCECVLAPPLPYGPTMSWAAGPDEGEVDFAPEPFFLYVKEILKRLMDMGFKNVSQVTIVSDAKFWDRRLYRNREETVMISNEIGDAIHLRDPIISMCARRKTIDGISKSLI